MYIPNTQKWVQFYQNLGKDGSNPYIKYRHTPGKQVGSGSLVGSPRQIITPAGLPHKGEHNEKVTVNLVSPVQQTINQAKDEVKRTNMKQGLKRKRSQRSVISTMKRPRKQTQKSKKSNKKSSVKRLKSTKKKTAKKAKKYNKQVPSVKKRKLLKSSFKDIFA